MSANMKICSKCNTSKDLICFNSCNSRKDGKQPYCRQCRKPMSQTRYNRKSGASNKKLIDVKYCPRCKDTKSSEYFNLSNWSTDGRQSYCRECISGFGKNTEYREKRNKSRRKYSSVRVRKTEEEKRIARRQAKRDKLRDNIQFRISERLRTRLWIALKKKVKVGSAVRDLGCSIEYLESYLESLFQTGMSWSNWGAGPGKWNIDHVIPLHRFDLTNKQHFLLANNYLNLQPLWFEDNLAKNRKSTGLKPR